MTVAEGIAILAQLVTLSGVVGGIFISLNNSRMIAEKASKGDVERVHELVNGKSEQLERMIKEKAFKAGVEEGEKK